MTATGFELLGELEDEFEEEAAELELLFPRGRAGTRAAPRKPRLTDPLPYGCIDVRGRCISDGCAAPYKCVRRLGGGCECRPGRPGKPCPEAPDPASGECLQVLRRDGNYLVCCPKYYGTDDPCCRDYPIPSQLRPATKVELVGELEDEFEEEAMELEPLFSRRKPMPVRRWARNAAYQGDLDDELEGEALELEPLFSRRGIFEFEDPADVKLRRAKAQAFLQQVRKRPFHHQRLFLTVILHPQPILASVTIPGSPGIKTLGQFAVEADIKVGDLLDELRLIANRNFPWRIEKELQLRDEMFATTGRLVAHELGRAPGKSVPQKLKPFLLDSLLNPDNPAFTGPLGDSFAQKMLPPRLAQRIRQSKAREAHHTSLGRLVRRYAEVSQERDPAFKQLVEQERKKLLAPKEKPLAPKRRRP